MPPATRSIGSISNTMPPPLVLPPRPCFPFVPTTVVMPPHVTPPAFDWCPSQTFLCLESPSPFCHPSRLPTALWPAPRRRSIVAACSAVHACLHLRLRGYVYARLPYELLCIRRHWESWGISLPCRCRYWVSSLSLAGFAILNHLLAGLVAPAAGPVSWTNPI